MVSFSNMDGAHCDSVVDHYTLPSNSIQMDVKVPVQPSNFDPLQKGALMGASTFMEQDKNHSNQCNYKTKSIPSPGIYNSQVIRGEYCGQSNITAYTLVSLAIYSLETSRMHGSI